MTTAAAIAPRPKLWTGRVALVLSAQLLFGMGWSTHLVQPKFLASRLGADPEAIARVVVMSPLAALAIIPLAVRLMDTVNRAWLFRAGLLVLLTASLGYATVDHLSPILFLFQGCVGASYALSYYASAAMVADEAPPERLGEAIGLLGASNVVTNAVATTLAEHLASAFGWPAAFCASAGFALLALAVSVHLSDERHGRTLASPGPILPALRGPLGVVLACSAFVGAGFSAMFMFHQPYVLLLGGKTVSPFFIGFTIAAVSVRVFFGSLGDRLGHGRVSVVTMFLYAAVALATAWLHVNYLWVYGLAFGTAHGILYPTLNTYAVYVSPEGMRGRVIALYGGAFNVGIVLSTFAWGKVATGLGFPAVFVGAALVVATGALVLAACPRAKNNAESSGRV